jgi:hypothetical protein
VVNFQARIRPQWRLRFPHLKGWKWYDVEPQWPGSNDRAIDMAGKRVTRLRTGTEHTLIRAEYVFFRPVEVGCSVGTQ